MIEKFELLMIAIVTLSLGLLLKEQKMMFDAKTNETDCPPQPRTDFILPGRVTMQTDQRCRSQPT